MSFNDYLIILIGSLLGFGTILAIDYLFILSVS